MTEKYVKTKSSYIGYILLMVIVLGLFGVLIPLSPQVVFSDCPKQSEQVEVVGERKVAYSFDRRTHSQKYYFVIAFMLPDGTTKELEIDVGTTKEIEETESSPYNAIYEGDKGILIFQELEDIVERFEGREDESYLGRRFIRFAKDPD